MARSTLNSFSSIATKSIPNTIDFASREFQVWILITALLPAILFVVLSPGLLLNLPKNSVSKCASLIPYPLAYNLDGSVGASKTTVDPNNGTNGCGDASPGAGIKAICDARAKCNKYWVSTYTSTGAVFLHSAVFLLLLIAVSMTLKRYA
jgi:hypothetical protein